MSIVDVRDIAEVAAAALTESGHERKTYDVTGPEALTHAEMESKSSEASGKQVNFVYMPESAMREAVPGLGLLEWRAEGLIEDYAHYRRGEAANVSTAVQEVTGRPARSFEGFARDYKEVLHD